MSTSLLEWIICRWTHLLVHFRAPPLEPIHPSREDKHEENDDNAHGQSTVQCRAQCHVVLIPPLLPPVPDMIIEHVAHNCPDTKVQPCSRWNPGQGTEDYGKTDPAEDGFAVAAGGYPEDDRRDGTEQESPYERAIQRTWSEELLGTNDTPQDAAVEVDACDGTGETVDRLRRTDARDEGEHPIQYTNLRQARYYSCRELKVEEYLRGDLHVMAQL